MRNKNRKRLISPGRYPQVTLDNMIACENTDEAGQRRPRNIIRSLKLILQLAHILSCSFLCSACMCVDVSFSNRLTLVLASATYFCVLVVSHIYCHCHTGLTTEEVSFSNRLKSLLASNISVTFSNILTFLAVSFRTGSLDI